MVLLGCFCFFLATLTVGNILPVGSVPEGAVICNVEARVGDRGTYARASGDYAVVVGQDDEKGVTKIRLPSGAKKTIASTCRAQVSEPVVLSMSIWCVYLLFFR